VCACVAQGKKGKFLISWEEKVDHEKRVRLLVLVFHLQFPSNSTHTHSITHPSHTLCVSLVLLVVSLYSPHCAVWVVSRGTGGCGMWRTTAKRPTLHCTPLGTPSTKSTTTTTTTPVLLLEKLPRPHTTQRNHLLYRICYCITWRLSCDVCCVYVCVCSKAQMGRAAGWLDGAHRDKRFPTHTGRQGSPVLSCTVCAGDRNVFSLFFSVL
jgi:hypothetical protein